MKSVLVLALFLIPALSFAQSKKDKKVIATVTDTANLLKKVSLLLYEKGYTIEQKDEDLKFIATREKSIKYGSVKIRAMIKDSTITFTAVCASNVTLSMGSAKEERTFYEVYYGGMKGSEMRNAWDELDRIAQQFGRVTYAK